MNGSVSSRRPLVVRFTGDRAGAAPLTWAQRDIWDLYEERRGRHCYFNHGRVYRVPHGRVLTDVRAAVAALFSRYEAFRTTVHRDEEGVPRQRVAATGELAVEVVDADDAPSAEAAAEAVRTRYLGHCFDDEEWPVRFGVVCVGPAPAYVVLMASHLAVDRVGLDIASRAFVRLLAGDKAGPVGRQPLDQAEEESSARGDRVGDRAAAYWRRTLLAAEPMRFPAPTSAGRPRWPSAELDSTALALAVHAVARQHRVPPAAAVLAAVSAQLHRRTRSDTVMAQLVAANRVTRETRDMVGTFAQLALFAVDCTDTTFHGLVRRSWAAMALAYRHGRYPPHLIRSVVDEVDRHCGLGAEVGCYVNNFAEFRVGRDEKTDLDRITFATAGTRYRAGAAWPMSRAFNLELRDSPSGLRLTLATDARILDAADVEILLHGVEALLVRAAGEDYPLAEVAVAATAGGHYPAFPGHASGFPADGR